MANIAFSPITIGGVTIPNRFFRSAHQMHMCPGGRVSERLIAYHEARAAGGTGLIILEASPIHWSSAAQPDLLTIWDDEAIEGLARLRERIAAHGAKLFIQIWHGGQNAFPWDGSPPWSCSPISGPAAGIPALEMTKAMIDEIVDAYAQAARRAHAAGLDGVEVHAAHGYLPRQFLAPATNWRTDEYGGPFENRVRFLQEVMRAVRAAVPASFAVGTRMGPDLVEGMSDLAENIRAIRLLEEEGLLDFVGTTLGNYVAANIMACGMEQPAGYQIPYFGDLANQIRSPVLAVGRFRTTDEAAQVIRAGQAAMIGMVRAQIADPDVVKKSAEGHPERVRPCIACNQRCVGGIPTGNVGCSVNAAAGRELEFGADRIMPAATSKRILIVGGGAGGMEAARMAALRGHKVKLFEAQPDLGGKVRFVAKRAPRMSAFGDITHWLEAEIYRLGVEVQTNSYVEHDDLRHEDADAIIIATGSVPRMDGAQRHRLGQAVKGIDLPHVYSSTDILIAPREHLGKTAVVLDDIGHYEAVAAAEHLINLGLSVTYVTRFGSFAPLLDVTLRNGSAFERMNMTGRFMLRTRAQLRSIERGRIVVFDPHIDPVPEEIAADSIVLVGYNAPNNALKTDLKGCGATVICIGDALSPRYIDSAIHEGFHAALSI